MRLWSLLSKFHGMAATSSDLVERISDLPLGSASSYGLRLLSSLHTSWNSQRPSEGSGRPRPSLAPPRGLESGSMARSCQAVYNYT